MSHPRKISALASLMMASELWPLLAAPAQPVKRTPDRPRRVATSEPRRSDAIAMEIADHNAEVDRRKAEKRARRAAGRKP